MSAPSNGAGTVFGNNFFLFEPELALLVGLQVMSSKEGGRREEGGRTF